MLNSILDQLPNKTLIQKKNLATIALIAVGLGAIVAFLASFYAWMRDGVLPETTFFTAVIALIAAYPVFKERRRMVEILSSRKS